MGQSSEEKGNIDFPDGENSGESTKAWKRLGNYRRRGEHVQEVRRLGRSGQNEVGTRSLLRKREAVRAEAGCEDVLKRGPLP